MRDKVLVFIPYQDTDNYFSDGILTREYAMLYLFYEKGYKKVLNIKKPRTWLDKKRYSIRDEIYPEGSIECKVKSILEDSVTIQYFSHISFQQILKKRGWWLDSYLKSLNQIMNHISEDKDYLVYSNNPYACKLLRELKEAGCNIYFDIMDNFSIHPSLGKAEQEMALEGYKKILKFADVVSANSEQTCEFMKQYSNKEVLLVKNGVFLENAVKDTNDCKQTEEIRKQKKKFKKVVGYIGKLGKRLDANLIEELCKECPDVLFVFVGPYLKGQINEKLISIFDSKDNVIHLDGVPSAYVYAILNEFDILMIPHSVGKNENGGDPLKLYQYLTRKKPIITTPILGVNEFKDYIEISSVKSKWVDFVNNTPACVEFANVENFSWSTRIEPVWRKVNL